MKSLLVAIMVVLGATATYAAEPAKKEPVKKEQKAPVKKQCDMLKDKNCDKAPPSANKPIPKKKAEAK